MEREQTKGKGIEMKQINKGIAAENICRYVPSKESGLKVDQIVPVVFHHGSLGKLTS